ncbi:hypothetical protein [Actinacidiphila glaucinigra]|uniref:hypothetical protein n=1 Tax=Actinacidiphila glaucinigra TaxID=235986 RepID=UPI0037166B94
MTTRRLDRVRVDAGARTAHVGAGASWGPVADAAARGGLAPLVGSSPSVGVGPTRTRSRSGGRRCTPPRPAGGCGR